MSADSGKEWARDYFERGYAQRWGPGVLSDRVRLEADGLWNLLELSPACRVIDLGCGRGLHALALAQRQANVVGLDFAVSLLQRARDLAAECGAHVGWIRGDMRTLPFQSGCAIAAILMDAFGFFDTEEENTSVLSEAARVVAPGGRLAVKIVNGGLLLDEFRETEREERDGVVVSAFNTLTFDPPRMTQRITVSGTRGDGIYQRRQRLYRADELCETLEAVGMSVLAVFANPDGTPFDRATSSAIWIVARRRNSAPIDVSPKQ